MRVAKMTVRTVLMAGTASLVAGCVQPAYVQPGPIQLQGYPPPVSYRAYPNYRPPTDNPIALQPPPLVQPLPPAAAAPSVTVVPDSDLGPIPVQDMPTPTSDAPTSGSTSGASTVSTPEITPMPAAQPEIVRRAPATGLGNNVPLEGFRPMKAQTRPTP